MGQLDNAENTNLSEEHKDDILDEIRKGTYEVGDVGEDDEESDEDVEKGRLFTSQNYEAPKDVDKFINTSRGEIIDKSKLSTFDVIKAVAKQTNVEIRNPRPGCKHCYGRGYIGWDSKTKSPIPCNCIYPPKTPNQKRQELDNNKKIIDRKTFKQIKKLIKAEKKLIKKQVDQEKQRLKQIEG